MEKEELYNEAWRRCGFAIGQHEIPLMVENGWMT